MADKSMYFDTEKRKFTENVKTVVDGDIESAIGQIIEKRKLNVPKVKKQQETLGRMKAELTSFMKKKNEFASEFSQSEGMKNNFSVSERNEILEHISAITDEEIKEIINTISVAENENSNLLRRIDKDNICIAIAGGARNGKSTLIQTITGLDEATVPTSEEGFCTGARSTIENCSEFRAEIDFYTEKELLETVIKRYCMHYEKYGTIQLPLNSLEDIKRLYDYLKSSNLPEDSQYLKRLGEYANQISEYREYLGKESIIYYESDKDKIRKFVSQISKDGKTKFFDFLAVKRARIYCPFAVTKVRKIVLVDTVGLGEASLGVEDEMLETASKEADFIVILRKMSTDSQAIPMDSDYKQYNKITQANGKIPPEKWCYWVFNRQENQYKEGIFENRYYSAVKETLEAKKNPSYPAGILNVDCSNQDEVMECLINPMLNLITQNLEDIDRCHFLTVEDRLKEVNIRYSKLMLKVKTVTVSKQTSDEFFSYQFEDSHKKLVEDLHKFCSEYREEINRIIPILEMIKITNEMVKAVPKINEIEQKWKTVSKQSYLLTMNWAFDETVKNLERMLEDKTKNYEQEIKEFKKKVIKEILKASKLEKCIIVDYEDDLVVDSVAKDLFSSFKRCKHLEATFHSMQQFNIKDQLDMQKKLNRATQKYLNVNNNPDSEGGLFPTSWTKDTGAVELQRALLNHIAKIQTTFMIDAETLKFMPSNEMKDKLSAFINDITNDENKEGWRMVYEANKTILWREDLEKLERDAKQIQEWSDMIQILKQCESDINDCISNNQ